MSEGNSHFLMAIGRHDGGSVIETADEQLRDVVQAVMRTGKKGTVTLVLEVDANGDKGLKASCKVASKAPSVSFGQAFYFTDMNGDLTRNAPADTMQTTFKELQE